MKTLSLRLKLLLAVVLMTLVAGGLFLACGSDKGSPSGAGCEAGGCEGGALLDGNLPPDGGSGAEGGALTDGPNTGDAGADGAAAFVCAGDGGDAGGLDPTFGDGGIVVLTYPASSANSVVVQSDGKIVVGGYTAQSLAIVRLLPDGSLDSSFGAGGLVKIPLGDFGAIVSALALQPDGRIVGAGSAHIVGSAAGDRGDFAIVRLLSSGALDPTFDAAGIVTTNIGGTDQAHGVAILADGHVLASGNTGKVSDHAMVRYNADGTIDSTFGTAGKVTSAVGSFFDYANGMAVLADGRILLAGGSSEDGGAVSNTHFSAARYGNLGALDTTFADGGRFIASDIGTFADLAFAIVLDASGRPVLAGSRGGDFTLLRLTTTGAIDATFGVSGFAATDFGGDEQAYALAVEPDGKLVATGTRGVGASPVMDLVVARYSRDGSLDPSCGTAGKVVTSFAPLYGAVGNAAAIKGCGLTVVGTLNDQSVGGTTAMGIVRYRL